MAYCTRQIETKSWLSDKGLQPDMKCCLCQAGIDSVDHLFFECDFSKAVWKKGLMSQGIIRDPKGWMHEFRWIMRVTKGRNNPKIKLKILFAAAVYKLWKERNKRTFRAESSTSDAIIGQILNFLHLRLM